MEVNDPHPWDVKSEEARRLQGELRERLLLVDGVRLAEVRTVAGVDVAYARAAAETVAYAAVVVLGFPELELREQVVVSVPVTFPYVPGLLSFREGPAVLAAFRRVERVPDVVLFDA